MRTLPIVGILGCLALAASVPALGRPLPQPAPQQQEPGGNAAVAPGAQAPATVEAIDAEFQREIRDLEVRRLERIAGLAAGQQGAAADAILETYFRRAIDAGLFAEAEPQARQTLEAGQAGPVVTWLAHLVKIFADAERGAFQESLDSLVTAIHASDDPGGDAAEAIEILPLEARLKLEEAYFQRLVRAGQYAIAREAFTALLAGAKDPVIRDFTASRLKQLELVGQSAPPIEGEDLDGQPVRLADFRGDVVLVVFWASWCLPNAEQASGLDAVLKAYRDQGFRVLGVNVDALDAGVEDVATVLPQIRRFLFDHNITWPSVLDTPADGSIAEAYGVIDLPTSVLIGRDGTVRGLALTGSEFELKVSEALHAPRP